MFIQDFLYISYESFTNGFASTTLDIISLIAIVFSIYVIISKNPVVSVLHLIGLFGSISVFLINLGINYIGLSYLLVYVGAISILFLFILMLIDIRISELHSDSENSIPLTIIIAILINNALISVLPNQTIFNDYFKNTSIIDFVSFTSWENNIWESTHIETLGNIIYTSHSILLIIVSLILLVSMIGSIVITNQQR